MSEFVLLLGARLMGGSYIDAIHQEKHKAVVVDVRANLDRWSDICDVAIELSEDSPEAWVAAALAAARSHPLAAVIAYADEQVIAAAIVAQLQGLPSPGLLAAIASRNKSTIRSINSFASLPQPRALISPYVGLAELGGVETSVVVQKVLGGAGSEGVSLVAKCDAPIPSEGPVILEEYVEGDYFSSELFIADGEIVFTNHTSKTSGGPPEFVDLGHLVGVRLPRGVSREAERMLRSIVSGYRIAWGIVHIEWISACGRLAIIEFAVRTPGDFLMYGIERAHGFDAFGAVVRIGLGHKPLAAVHHHRSVGVSFFPIVEGDPGSALDLIKDRWAESGLYIGYWRSEQAARRLESSDDRNHHVLVVGDDERAARQLALEIQAALHEHAWNAEQSNARERV